ncbi:hypothetical protein F5Y16DRAFT_397007 [Xylariaceae sp. FL0255]|nr:hypothetical protein F5Y16DRAFT_397007 [Xylariaceae sp. FL0255]
MISPPSNEADRDAPADPRPVSKHDELDHDAQLLCHFTLKQRDNEEKVQAKLTVCTKKWLSIPSNDQHANTFPGILRRLPPEISRFRPGSPSGERVFCAGIGPLVPRDEAVRYAQIRVSNHMAELHKSGGSSGGRPTHVSRVLDNLTARIEAGEIVSADEIRGLLRPVIGRQRETEEVTRAGYGFFHAEHDEIQVYMEMRFGEVETGEHATVEWAGSVHAPLLREITTRSLNRPLQTVGGNTLGQRD